ACGTFGAHPDRYTGTIEATEVEVASTLGGQLVAVHVGEGDRVAAGALVFELDRGRIDTERSVREAAVAVAEAGIEAARAGEVTAGAQVRYLQRESTRAGRMADAGVASDQQRSSLQGQLDVARAQMQAAAKGIASAEAGAAQARAALAAVVDQADDTQVHATMPGVVVSRNHEPGEVIGPGMSVVTVADLDHPRLRVYVPLLTVGTLSLGDAALVILDARPDAPVPGRVERIASQAEFTPRDILTPEERVKRVFAVDIAVDPGPGMLPGVPAEAVFQ
ncbi:MAG: HlyD family secretion protein, partial [Myxococcota bacterium]